MDLRPSRRRVALRLPPRDLFVLPAVTVLLLVGAAFLALAWRTAQDASSDANRADAQRAQRDATAVAQVVRRQRDALTGWVDTNRELLLPGAEPRLRAALDERVASDGSATLLGWSVVRSTGVVAATGERAPGAFAAAGLSDDLVALGRTATARDRDVVGGLLDARGARAYALAVPVPVRGATSRGALVAAYLVDGGVIDAVVPPARRRGADASTVSLLDARGRVLAGAGARARDGSGETGVQDDGASGFVERPVAGTGWSVLLERSRRARLLPTWTYPGFAVLLVVLAIGYAVQELTQTRLRELGDERQRRIRTLYELASQVLHARAPRDQGELLARFALELAHIDGARVRVLGTSGTHDADHDGVVAGTATPGQREYRVAITGPRAPLGELVAYRAAGRVGEEERTALRAAAALVGSAMHTSRALEVERAAATELQRLDDLRSNLLATVAHELRSPLTAVKGVLGLLSMQSDLGSDRNREYVSVATERTDRLVALTNDLFDCSLLDTGQLDIRPQRVLASSLLEAALGAQAAARAGELVLSATSNLLITVDPVRFDQLVNNLVTNALRHGAAPVEVAVRPWVDGAAVIVTDHGPGIPPEDRERVFGRFVQGSVGHARASEGAGLGLSLVRGLVELHGGTVTIDAAHADGRGARFTAHFPDVVPQPDTPAGPEFAAGRPHGSPDDDLGPIRRIV